MDGFDLGLFWIEIGVKKNRNELARPAMGTIFLFELFVVCQNIIQFLLFLLIN